MKIEVGDYVIAQWFEGEIAKDAHVAEGELKMVRGIVKGLFEVDGYPIVRIQTRVNVPPADLYKEVDLSAIVFLKPKDNSSPLVDTNGDE